MRVVAHILAPWLRRIPVRWVAICLLAAGSLGLHPQMAGAQLFDLQKLFQEQQATPAPAPPQPPLQSLPAPSFDPARVPTAQDYATLPSSAADDEMLGRAEQWAMLFKGRLIGILERAPSAFEEVGTTLAAASPTGRPGYFAGVVAFAGLLLAAGRALAELVLASFARPLCLRMQRPDPRGYLDKLPVLACRVSLTVLATLTTLIVATAIGIFFYDDHLATLQTVVTVFATYAAIALVESVWRMALAPFLPGYRLPQLDDQAARKLYRWLSLASGYGIASAAFAYWLQGLGLPADLHVLITLGLTLVTVIVLLAAIGANHRAISGVILATEPGREPSWVSRLGASLWAPAASVYLLVAWGDLAFRLVMGIEAGPGRLIVPYATLMAAVMVYAVTVYLIERVFARQRRVRELNAEAEARRRQEARVVDTPPAASEAFSGDSGDIDADGDEEGGGPPPVPEQRPRNRRSYGSGMRTMEDLARRVASLVALGAGGYAMVRFWGGADLFADSAFFGRLKDVFDVLFIGYIAFHAARIWLDQKIEEEGGDEVLAGPGEGEGGGAGATRLATLLPLVRNAILTVILVTIGLIMAMELGVNVGPLFAGAGIVGLAIGFGAQTLVRDIISGAFFLLDDAFRKGEYIDVGNVKGTVEKISLRSFQLRHHLGMLHTIPFGEIQFLTNFSRDWVIMKLPLRLTYDTDVERVRKLIKNLGLSLLDDPVIGTKFLQPLKSQGVIQMDDSAMILRVKFMTRPGEQWVVRKRVYAEIRDLFEREGIHFAHREVTVRMPDLPAAERLSEPEVRAIGAAARRAGDQVEEDALAAATAERG